MQEIWKDVIGYEGKYQISNLGNVKSLKSFDLNGKPIILKTHDVRGYVAVNLYQNNKIENALVHRLVAIHFIPNENNYKEVNHKDENKRNNCVDNLEWCTHKYNMNYATQRIRHGINTGNPINQFTLDGFHVATYYSAEFASKISGIDASSIIKCCRKKRKSAGGYKWEFNDTFKFL